MSDLTFREWLREQRWRLDAVGTLSCVLLVDPCSKGLQTFSSIRDHILSVHGACEGVIEALDTAIFEYLTRDIFEVNRED